MTTLAEYTQSVVSIFDSYTKTGTTKWDYKIAMQDLPYQVWSLAKRLMQLEGKRWKDNLSDDELKSSISDELADIFAEVLFIAHELNIDLDQAFTKMMESDKQKITSRQNK